jgi:hypothetical protein
VRFGSRGSGCWKKHPGIERVFKESDWANGRWADVLTDLELRSVDGQVFKAMPIGPVRYGGPQCRGLLVPAAVLPSIKDEEP